jgi:M6 family metalloprotease-like protein
MTAAAVTRTLLLLSLPVSAAVSGWALEPPTREQLAQYRADGSLAQRAAAARSFGNHRIAPHLALSYDRGTGAEKAAAARGLPSVGAQNVLAVLIAFQDLPGHTDVTVVDDQLFGEGDQAAFPYESLQSFYQRSSYGLLQIEGSTLGWYQTPYPRSDVEETTAGREALIREAITSFDAAGHDFAQYDNDGDGVIDYLVVIWAGPHQGWAEFWWGYQTSFQDQTFTVDGTRLGVYSWQWESYNYPLGEFEPSTVIHETGHALGLPDYYDYDESVGPTGGVGRLDQMDGNWGDHNCFSKYLLGWLQPQAHNEGTVQLLLSPTGEAPEAALLMHGHPRTDPYGEHFMIQFRRRQANDVDYPADGLLVWHVDARTGPSGGFLYDNSYTDHKLLRLMEADGLEQIERNMPADAGDFYIPGDTFGSDTVPSSHRYDGAPTNLLVDGIATVGDRMAFRASLGSGCALFCDAEVTRTAWPRVTTPFAGALAAENCTGSAVPGWQIGGLDFPGEAELALALPSGSFPWRFTGALEDALCLRQGDLLVCADDRCRQWRAEASMGAERALHGSVLLGDGRVLVAGGGGEPEIFDPVSREWTPTGEPVGEFAIARAVLLADGRVLLVGSTPADPVNAAIYDPVTDQWRLTGQMLHDRTYHAAAIMADGRVLVAGGYFFDGDDVVPVLATEVFDPATETWTVVGDLPEAMQLPALTPLADGRVLLTGNRKAMFFDPAAGTWGAPRTLIFPRSFHAAVRLGDDRVLLLGGADTVRLTVIDPASGQELLVGSLGSLRIVPAAAVLSTGAVLVAGGMNGSYQVDSDALVIDPATWAVTGVADMAEPRFAHELVVLTDGSVLATGGALISDTGEFVPQESVECFVQPQAPPLRVGGRLAP